VQRCRGRVRGRGEVQRCRGSEVVQMVCRGADGVQRCRCADMIIEVLSTDKY
jgi:hypothetical protein